MNKKLVTLAVAAALVAPAAAMADATLYGKINIYLNYLDVANGVDGWDLESDASRLGVKGSEDLGNGLKAIYQIELGVSIADANFDFDDNDRGSITMRNTFVGLSSQWGTLLAGRHDTPFKISAGKLDLFADTLADFNKIVGFEDLRADSTIMYVSPSFAGFQFSGAVIPTGGATQNGIPNADADSINEGWSVAGIYSNGPLFASVAYETLNGELNPSFVQVGIPPVSVLQNGSDYDKWRVGLGLLDWNGFTLSGVYENWSDYQGIPSADADLWQIQAGYAFGNNMIKAAYGENDVDVRGVNDMSSWAVGLDHNFSKRTKAYVLYTDVEDNVLPRNGFNDWDGFSVGMVHSF